jgi:hypothetical protein
MFRLFRILMEKFAANKKLSFVNKGGGGANPIRRQKKLKFVCLRLNDGGLP